MESDNQPVQQMDAWAIYALGIVVWIIVCIIFGYSVKVVFSWKQLVPILVCPFFLVVNLFIWSKPKPYDTYTTEVGILNTVERNAGYMIFALTAFFALITLILRDQPMKDIQHFYSSILIQFTALGFAVITLCPIWIPTDNLVWLVRWRHIKTIFLIFSVSLFLGGLIDFSLRLTSLGQASENQLVP